MLRLDAQQFDAATTADTHIVIEAVPGSGKTTTVVSRIAYLINEKQVPPHQICAMTYTNAAVDDMRRRATELFPDIDMSKVNICTIHKFANAISNTYRNINGQPPLVVVDDATRRASLRTLVSAENDIFLTDEEISSYEQAASYIKNMMINPKTDNELNDDAKRVFDQYQRALRMSNPNGIDFDDMLLFALRVLESSPTVKSLFTRRHSWWLIDEAQDCSPLQYEIFEHLTEGSNVTLVGDSDQSIYAFRGADPKLLLKYLKDPDYSKFEIETNYRSYADICDIANSFRHGGSDKAIIPIKSYGASVTQRFCTTPNMQYRALAKFARDKTGDTAVIYRSNDSAVPLVHYLMKNNIPFNMITKNTAFFTSRPISDVLSILKLANDPHDTESFMSIYYKLQMYISKKEANKAVSMCKTTNKPIMSCLLKLIPTSDYRHKKILHIYYMLQDMSYKPLTAQIATIEKSPYKKYLEQYGGESKVNILRHLAKDATDVSDLTELLDSISQTISQNSDAPAKLHLVTAHSAKGLEWDNVAIIDLNRGTFPITNRGRDALTKLPTTSEDEERRLMYVAITRARKSLLISSSSRTPSVFMKELEYII